MSRELLVTYRCSGFKVEASGQFGGPFELLVSLLLQIVASHTEGKQF